MQVYVRPILFTPPLMTLKKLSAQSFALLAGLSLFTACSTSGVMTAIPELDVSVSLPTGYTIETVTEDGFVIYRVYNGATPVADIEDHEGYTFGMDELLTVDGIEAILEESAPGYSVLDTFTGEYGSSVFYETPDYYGVIGGIQSGEIKVVCQTAATDTYGYEEDFRKAFDVCTSMVPSSTVTQ